MWVLHAHWQPPHRPADPGGILFWAETPEGSPLPRLRGQLPKKFSPHEHSFCLQPEMIRQRIGAGTPLDDAEVVYARMRLPSTRTGPLPSPELNHAWELDLETPPFLAPWIIHGLWLPAGKAFGVLANLPLESVTSGFILGQDARYWQSVCSFVLETLAEQKILPVLVQANAKGDQYYARWQPVLDGPRDGTRLAVLERAMPPVCRCESITTSAKVPAPPPNTPRALLDSFLKIMCDSLARSWGRSKLPVLIMDRENTLDLWLSALFQPDPRVKASENQLRSLHLSLRAWMRNLHAAGDDYFRIGFRLEAPGPVAPGEEIPNWQMHFLLQSKDDPSLIIPAEEIWFRTEAELASIHKKLEKTQDKLLAGLGYAARLFSPILTSLQARHPTGLDLDTDSAYKFLREAAPLLEQAGFCLIVPPWWNQRGSRLGVRVKLTPRSSDPIQISNNPKLGLNALVHFEWELALGETTLTRAEFEELAALKTPLVQVRGEWVQLDTEQVEAAIRFWEKQQHSGEMKLIEAAQLALGSDSAHGLPLDDVQAEGWVKDWLENLSDNQRLTELSQPQGLDGTLRPYQRFGYSWLAFFRQWGLGAILADDMGLGKTIQALSLLMYEKETFGRLPGPVLLVCPTSVVTNWEREVRRFTPGLKTLVHQGPNRLRGDEFIKAAKTVDLVFTSYALLRMDQETIQNVKWYGTILDEAQNIKNPSAKQTQAARKLRTDFRFALTGTPVENRLTELWSIMQFLNPGYLGPLERFRRDYVVPIERFGDPDATTRLREMVSPFILRRLKTDPRVIQDLPEKIEIKDFINLSEEQATLYEAVVQDSLRKVAESEGIARRGQVLTMLMQLKQVCNHPAQFLHEAPENAERGLRSNGRSGKLSRLI